MSAEASKSEGDVDQQTRDVRVLPKAEANLEFSRQVFANFNIKVLNPFKMTLPAPHMLLMDDVAKYAAQKKLQNKRTCSFVLRIYFAPKSAVPNTPMLGIDYLEAPIYLINLNLSLEKFAHIARQQLAIDYECQVYTDTKGMHLSKKKSLSWFGTTQNDVIELHPENLPTESVYMEGRVMPELVRVPQNVQRTSIEPGLKSDGYYSEQKNWLSTSSSFSARHCCCCCCCW